MPFGFDCEYPDFEACVVDQMSNGHSREAAEAICGSIQADTKEGCERQYGHGKDCKYGKNKDGSCKAAPRSIEQRATGETHGHTHSYVRGDTRTGVTEDHYHRVTPGASRTQTDDVGRETTPHSHSIAEEDRSEVNEAKEVRITPAEFRVLEEADGPVLEGYAAVFDAMSEDLGGFKEIVKPGAFERAINEQQDVRLLVNHDTSKIMARTKNNTLSLVEDGRGLRFRAVVNDTTYAQDLVKQVRRGDIDQVSFGFVPRDDEFLLRNGQVIRELRDVDIFDVSLTGFPAYPQTSVEVRNKVTQLRNAEAVEEPQSAEAEVSETPETAPQCECQSVQPEEVVEETNQLELVEAELELKWREI